jgi:hypothetical protein
LGVVYGCCHSGYQATQKVKICKKKKKKKNVQAIAIAFTKANDTKKFQIDTKHFHLTDWLLFMFFIVFSLLYSFQS